VVVTFVGILHCNGLQTSRFPVASLDLSVTIPYCEMSNN